MEHFDNIQTVSFLCETCGNLLAWPRRPSEIGPQLSAPALAPATLSCAARRSIPDGVKGEFLPHIRIPYQIGRLQLWRLTNMTRVGDVVSECHMADHTCESSMS